MSWLKKKADPISERAKSLNAEIAALEAQIKRLDTQLQRGQPTTPGLHTNLRGAPPTTPARVRSTALPQSAPAAQAPSTVTASPPRTVTREPIFEDLENRDLKSPAPEVNAPELYNEYGVRKFDLTAFIARVKAWFNGPTTTNPRLVNYLAAGGIQGLQPLRREKRVARNRLLLLAIAFCLILIGLIYMFARTR